MNARSAPPSTPRNPGGTSEIDGPDLDTSSPPGHLMPDSDNKSVGSNGNPRAARARPPALPSQVRLGHDASNPQATAPRLSTTRQAIPLRKILEALGPDMAAASCADLNHLHDIVNEAKAEKNLVIDFMATRTAIQEQRKFIELALGRTVNINTTIKSQRDLPRLDKLSTEKRAQLETLLTELATDTIIDTDFTDVSPNPAT